MRRDVEVLATPIYGFAGCDGPNHRSFLIAHRDDPRTALAEFRGDRAAVNSFDSNTGMNLFRASVAPLAEGKPFFADVVETGAHAASLAAVVERARRHRGDRLRDLRAAGARRLASRRGDENHRRDGRLAGAAVHRQPRAAARLTRDAVRRALRELPPIPELGLVGVAFLPETAYARVTRSSVRPPT